MPPISTLPGLGPLRIPSPVPIPNFARLYFRCVRGHDCNQRCLDTVSAPARGIDGRPAPLSPYLDTMHVRSSPDSIDMLIWVSTRCARYLHASRGIRRHRLMQHHSTLVCLALPARCSSFSPSIHPRSCCRFLEPVDTAGLDTTDEAKCRAIYADVRGAVEGGMAALQVRQEDWIRVRMRSGSRVRHPRMSVLCSMPDCIMRPAAICTAARLATLPGRPAVTRPWLSGLVAAHRPTVLRVA